MRHSDTDVIQRSDRSVDWSADRNADRKADRSTPAGRNGASVRNITDGSDRIANWATAIWNGDF